MRRTLFALLAALILVPVSAARAAEEPLPPQGVSPPGANDFSCKPPARHPYPVVLVHGTFGNMGVSWNQLAPDLERLHYCVFALDYGNNATGDIPTSARQLKTFVDRVLAATRAKKVSIVGHSQGGMMPRYYLKFLGGAARVDDLVGLSPSSHGTTLAAAGPGGALGCPACAQQAAGSPFLQHLNAGDQTPAPVDYSVIETNHDEVVTPYQSEFLPGPASRVTNVLLQKLCPSDTTEHVRIIYDSPALQLALDALGRPGPVDPKFRPDCTASADETFPDSSSVSAKRPAPRPVARVLGARRRGAHRLVVRFAVRNARARVRVYARRLRTSTVRRSATIGVRGPRRVTLVSRGRFTRGRYAVRVVGRAASGRKVYVRRIVSVR